MIKRIKHILALLVVFLVMHTHIDACSIFYYIDKATGKIYVVNNEDYYYSVKPYIQINPKDDKSYARLWYGWNDFAQGGINQHGLFFDGAATPKQKINPAYHEPNGKNIGDEILAVCKTVDEAIAYLEKEKIAITEGHMMFGDSTGNAAVVEWVGGIKKIVGIKNNMLIATNYLLSDTTAGNYPCYRYASIEERLHTLNTISDSLTMKTIGNAIGGAVQLPNKSIEGKESGTLYTSFINITDMELIIIPKLDNSKIMKFNLNEEFKKTKKYKVFL
jgi:penicillin V acylase-like amidase (Ntn superfamily)